MIQTRHWKRHLKVGLWVAVIVAVVLTGIVLGEPDNRVLRRSARFLALPFVALVDFLPPVENAFDSLPKGVAICNVLLFSAVVWGALAALISGMLSFFYPGETKRTPPR